MKTEDFILQVASMLTGMEHEIDLSGLDRCSYSMPDCLFIGSELEPDEDGVDPGIEILDENTDPEDTIGNLFNILSIGYDQKLVVELSPKPIELLMLIDALYGVLVQIEAQHNKVDLKVGALSIWLGDGPPFSITEYNTFLGDTLMNVLSIMFAQRSRIGSIGLYELHEKIDKTIPFFLLCPNVYLYEADGDDVVNAFDPFINFDLGYGSLLGWWRVERLFKALGYDFRLSIPEEDREWLQTHVNALLREFKWVYESVEGLLSEEGRKTYQDLIHLYTTIYSTENK